MRPLSQKQRWLLEQVRRGTDRETAMHRSGEVQTAGLCANGSTIASLARQGLVVIGGTCSEVDGDGFTVREDATWYAITEAGRAALVERSPADSVPTPSPPGPFAARTCGGCGKPKGCVAMARNGYWHPTCWRKRKAKGDVTIGTPRVSEGASRKRSGP